MLALSGLSDFFDGKIARKHNLVTNFGKFLDPLADKVLVISALTVFVENKDVRMSAIPLIIIIAREFMVSGLRLLAADSGIVVAAGIWGKLKTISQMAAVLVVLVLQYLLELNGMGIISLGDTQQVTFWFGFAGNAMLWISVLFTLISGIIYIAQNFEFIKTAK